MYGYAEIDTGIDAGVVNGSIGTTHRESFNAAEKALEKERRYLAKRLKMLSTPVRTASAHDGMVIPGMTQPMDQKKLIKYAVVGIVGYVLLRGLTR